MKKSILIGVLILSVLFVFSLSLVRAEPQPDLEKIVKKIDELYRSQSSEVTIEMEIVTPHWKRTLKMNAWSEGMEKTFIRILSPKKERGISTLKMGNEMWNFLPKTNKVMKVPPSMMMGSWMGSDFTNDDLVKEFTFMKDYTFQLAEIKDGEPGMVYVKCVPKEGRPIVWGHIIIASDAKTYMPKWQKYYDEKGKMMRQMNYREPKTFGERTIPTIMELVPTTKEGNKTIIYYRDAKFDGNVDKSIFSLRNLRERI